MDPVLSSPITEEQKKKVYDDLALAMIDGMEQGTFSDEESRASAEFVLAKLGTVKTEQELFQFLEELGKRWSIYEKVLLKLKGQKNNQIDQVKLQEVKNKLNQLIQ